MAYSRDQEREADELGFGFMVRSGYDPREAPQIWRNLIEELEAADRESPRSSLRLIRPARNDWLT